jgi:hypothetical protein
MNNTVTDFEGYPSGYEEKSFIKASIFVQTWLQNLNACLLRIDQYYYKFGSELKNSEIQSQRRLLGLFIYRSFLNIEHVDYKCEAASYLTKNFVTEKIVSQSKEMSKLYEYNIGSSKRYKNVFKGLTVHEIAAGFMLFLIFQVRKVALDPLEKKDQDVSDFNYEEFDLSLNLITYSVEPLLDMNLQRNIIEDIQLLMARERILLTGKSGVSTYNITDHSIVYPERGKGDKSAVDNTFEGAEKIFYHPEGTDIPEKYRDDSKIPLGPLEGKKTELAYSIGHMGPDKINKTHTRDLLRKAESGTVFVIEYRPQKIAVYFQNQHAFNNAKKKLKEYRDNRPTKKSKQS